MPSQGAGHIVVDDQSGHVFVSSPYADSGSMLDAASGRLRTVGGTQPGPLAVDTRTRRVFVLNGGGGWHAQRRGDHPRQRDGSGRG